MPWDLISAEFNSVIFLDRQIIKLKTSPNFPAIQYLCSWDLVALFPYPCRFRLHAEHGGPGVISQVHDIKGGKVVQRTYLNVGALGLRTARRVKVPGNLSS